MSNSIDLSKSLNIHLRVIKALVMREILTRYGRHNIGFLWLFIEPMLLTLGVTVFWHYTFQNHEHGQNISITAFAVTGYSGVQLWRTTAGRCINSLLPNLSLLYHRNVGVLEIYFARIILELAGATSAFVLMIVIFIGLEIMPPPEDLFKLMLGWILLGWFGAALGLNLGPATEINELFDRIWHPISYLLFPLSGAMFLVDWLPSKVQSLALWMPMISANELIRSGYFGDVIDTHYDIVWLISCNMFLTITGMFLCGYVGQRVEHE